MQTPMGGERFVQFLQYYYHVIPMGLKCKYSRQIVVLKLNPLLQIKRSHFTNYAKHFKQPDNKNNYNYNVQQAFDFTIHWNIIVDEVQDNARNNQHDYNS